MRVYTKALSLVFVITLALTGIVWALDGGRLS